MLVTHRLTVTTSCPSGGRDVYEVTVETDALLRVEAILDYIDTLTSEPLYQEDLTEALAAELGAKVTTVGRHLNVVETTVVAGEGDS